MVEIVGRIVRHPKLSHDAARSEIRWNCERYDLLQTQSLESITDDLPRTLSG